MPEPNAEERKSSDVIQSSTNDESKWGHNPDTWMVVLTGLLMFIGVGTGVIFYRQFQEMKTQSGILGNQALEASTDSIEANKRAERQLKIAEQQARTISGLLSQYRLSERAWIGVTSMAINLKPGEPVYAQVGITNGGKTTATHMTLEYVFKLSSQPLNIAHFVHTSHRRPTSKEIPATLLPGVSVPLNTFVPGEWDIPGLLQLLTTRQRFIYLFGEVKYWDTYGVHHFTHFCGEYTTDSKAFEPTDACDGYTDAD